jgi:hypothetical protein
MLASHNYGTMRTYQNTFGGFFEVPQQRLKLG